MYPEFLKRNVSFAVISTDDTADALKMMELTGAEFAILSDEDAEVAKDYGVYNLLHDGVRDAVRRHRLAWGRHQMEIRREKHLRPAGSR